MIKEIELFFDIVLDNNFCLYVCRSLVNVKIKNENIEQKIV